MRRFFVGVSLVAACFSAVGCVSAEPREDRRETRPEPVDTATDDIIAGTADTSNDAVVAVLILDGAGNVQGQCSGTIISKNGSTGYVLTAGHCKGTQYAIFQADDYGNCFDGGGNLTPNAPGCDAVYFSNGDLRHPQYSDDYFGDGSMVPGPDFLVIRFTGATAATPVIPADDGSSGFNNGGAIELVGYGLMNSGGSLVETTGRRHANNNANTIYSGPPVFDFDQSFSGPGGTCQGDSGGPALHNGYVVGVTSFGEDGCQGTSYSAHVAQEYAFIAGYIGADVPPQTCDECVNDSVSGGQCTATLTTCQNDAACNALLTCFGGCSTDACYNDCAAANPGGVDGYNAIVTCAYCDACDPICNEAFCDAGSTTSAGPGATAAVGVGAGAGATTGTGAGAGDAVGVGTGVGTGTGDATGTGTGTGTETGGGGANAGSGGDDGGSKKSGGSDDSSSSGNSSAADDGGCAVAQTGASSHGGLFGFGIAGLAFAVAAKRRRRA